MKKTKKKSAAKGKPRAPARPRKRAQPKAQAQAAPQPEPQLQPQPEAQLHEALSAALQALLVQAAASHRRGDLQGAERGYRSVLAEAPQHFDALHLLGAVRAQAGAPGEAVELISRAIAIRPGVAEAHNNLGYALKGLKRLEEALDCYRRALALRPDYFDAHRNLGSTLLALNRPADAVGSFEKVLTIKPSADAYCNLGAALGAAGRLEEAIACYRKALAIHPGHAAAHNRIGNALMSLDRASDALEAFRKALEIKPDYAEALHNCGHALVALKRNEEAIGCYRKALALRPGIANGHYNLARALNSAGRIEESIAEYRKAIAINPAYAKAYNNLGSALFALNRHAEAVEVFGKALSVHPGYSQALNNLGNVLVAQNRYEEAIDAYRRALAIKPGYVAARNHLGNALQTMGRYQESAACYEAVVASDPRYPFAPGLLAAARAHLCDWRGRAELVQRIVTGIRAGQPTATPFSFITLSDDPADQMTCAVGYIGRRHPPAPQRLWSGAPYRHERIRIAYLSADFREHPVGWLIAELIERHDRGRFETFGFSFGPDAPGTTRARLKSGFEHFLDVRSQTDAGIAAALREAEIDIAVDLMGHTLNARMGVFALRPAPIQVKYIGYAATTGADYFDYVIADAHVVPEAHEQHFVEKIARLPNSYLVSDTTREAACTPTRREAGLPERGFVFCCFNNSNKISPESYDIWMRLLSRVEDSVLWLVAQPAVIMDNLRREAQARGIAAERLVFAPRAPQRDYLARYPLADLFLDTLPYNAHSTAIDALWMGVPLVTCPGRAFAARVGASVLNAIGLPELIARSPAEYEALALELATRPERHAAFKARLAEKRRTAPLFDIERYRRDLESAYRTMWEIQRRGEPPRSFSVEAALARQDR